MGEECDYWVGNTCRITVSEEVGKDGIKSIGFKDSLGLGTGLSVCEKNKKEMVEKTTQREKAEVLSRGSTP